MSYFAINCRTEKTHFASELSRNAALRGEKWRCPGCPATMIPAAADGARRYKVAPYFRSNGSHALSCNGDGQRILAESGRRCDAKKAMGAPAVVPHTLRLVDKRPQVPRDGQISETGPIPRARRNPNAGVDSARSGFASTLHPIVEHYVLYPEHRDEELNITGCQGKTYEQCFQQLRNSNEAKSLPQHVYFANIMFKSNGKDLAELFLWPAVWIADKSSPMNESKERKNYRVVFNTDGWGEDKRKRLITELNEQREKQKKFHNTEATQRVNIFFFGRQDDEDKMTFHINDYRLFYFFEMEKKLTDPQKSA